MAESILPRNLPAASVVPGDAAIIIDTGSAIQKADPLKVVDAAAPIASQSDAETGSDNVNRMTALRVKQAIDTLGVSAADLASHDPGKGAGMVAVQGGGTLADASPFVVRPASGTDISAALTAAIALADGKKIVIPPGNWTAKNVDVTGATIEFTAGAKVTMTLGAEENGFYTFGGTTLIRPVIEVSNSAVPPHGGWGNAVFIGQFRTFGTLYDGLEIIDGTFTSLNNGAYGLAISCLGRVRGVRLRGTTKIIGRFAAAFQAHWGGDLDMNDPHYSQCTESYHPYDIHIDTLQCVTGGPYNRNCYLGVSLSAAYNVTVDTLLFEGDRAVWVQPGDVYDLVAGEDQKDKIMSGIRFNYIEVRNPPQNSTTYSNVLVSGLSATMRVPGQTVLVAATNRTDMDVELREVRVLLEPGNVYDTAPIVRMHYAKNSRVSAYFMGFTTRPVSSLAQVVQSTDCEMTVKGTGPANAVSGHGNVRCIYNVDWDTGQNAGSVSTAHRAVTLGSVSGTATVSGAVAVGATSITISTWSGIGSQHVINGTRLYLSDTQYVTLSDVQIIGTGATTIAIEPAPFAISDAAVLTYTCRELDSEIRGNIKRSYTAVELTNTDGIKVPATISYSAKHDIALTGVVNRRLLANGYYDSCGQLNDGGTRANIHLGGAGVLSYGVTVRGAIFEASGTPLVENNVYGRATSNAHVGLKVTDCYLNSTSHPVNSLWPTNAAVLNAGPPQVYGNRRSAAMGTATYDFDIDQGATMQVGGAYYIWRTNLPGSGNWPNMSRWFNPAATTGVSPGSVRSSAGVWVAEPVL